MIFHCCRKFGNQSPALKKARYALRTILYLEYKKKKTEINLRLGEVRMDSALTFSVRREIISNLLIERERLELSFFRSPINCWKCHDRMADLIQDKSLAVWSCLDHVID